MKEPRWGVRGLPLLLALAPELFQPPVKGFAVLLKSLCRDAQLFCVFSEGFRALLLPEWVILRQIHRRESGFGKRVLFAFQALHISLKGRLGGQVKNV